MEQVLEKWWYHHSEQFFFGQILSTCQVSSKLDHPNRSYRRAESPLPPPAIPICKNPACLGLNGEWSSRAQKVGVYVCRKRKKISYFQQNFADFERKHRIITDFRLSIAIADFKGMTVICYFTNSCFKVMASLLIPTKLSQTVFNLKRFDCKPCYHFSLKSDVLDIKMQRSYPEIFFKLREIIICGSP